MKTNKTWQLPKPDFIDGSYVWKPVVRLGSVVPFGYRQDPDDCDILLPIPEELELFELAKKHLKRYSYREVSAWLTTQSGRYISHVGLYNRVKLEQRRKTQAATQRYLAKRYKEALEKAERLEGRLLGQKEYISTSATET
jgi:hypothetical protein